MESKLKEQLQKQRSRKRKQDDLHEAIDKIASFDLSEVVHLQEERFVDAILLSKFKPDDLIAISYLAKQLPATLPASITQSIMEEAVLSCPLNVSKADATTLYYIFQKFSGILLSRQQKTAPETLTRCKWPLFRVLAPPCDACLQCNGSLSLSSTPTNVTVFTLEDVIPGRKIGLKCQRCNIRYGYAFYGNSTNGYRFYDTPRSLVEVSGLTYFDRKLCLSQIFLANHGWLSFEGFTESYNETMQADKTTLETYLTAHPDQTANFLGNISRKLVSDSFYQHEIEGELRERGLSWSFSGDDSDSLTAVLRKINELRSSEIYPHPDDQCSEACAARGCKNFTSMDGIWKLRYPICMFPVKTTVAGFEALNFPDVCTKAPYGKGSAFCEDHCKTARDSGIPTSLRDFLREYCGVSDKCGEENAKVSEEEVNVVRMKTRLMKRAEISQSMVTTQQGTREFITKHAQLLNLNGTPVLTSEPTCNKDTGENQKCLQKWSRGLLHFVRGGGHIESWSPLFSAESPGQVFLLAIHYLYRRLKDVPEEEWEEFILSYDNMCNVCRMLCARQPLPLNPPFDKLWLKVTKVIDRLHLRNHKNKQCHEIFSPEPFKEKNPHLNTPVAEQVFTWSARFKKILCAMPQERFLFYYHRMVVRRNRYTSKCHRESRPPVLPKVRSQFST